MAERAGVVWWISREQAESGRVYSAIGWFGCGLSIDDFGTGYSSLAYLKRFPLKRIKIDKSFVRDLDTNADDRTIAKSIILMAHGLNVSVVTEGERMCRSSTFCASRAAIRCKVITFPARCRRRHLPSFFARRGRDELQSLLRAESAASGAIIRVRSWNA